MMKAPSSLRFVHRQSFKWVHYYIFMNIYLYLSLTLFQLGREEPAMSMDSSGKIMWARHSEVQQANLKTLGESEIQDGEKLPLGAKDIGSCEIYPQTIQHSPNGR